MAKRRENLELSLSLDLSLRSSPSPLLHCPYLCFPFHETLLSILKVKSPSLPHSNFHILKQCFFFFLIIFIPLKTQPQQSKPLCVCVFLNNLWYLNVLSYFLSFQVLDNLIFNLSKQLGRTFRFHQVLPLPSFSPKATYHSHAKNNFGKFLSIKSWIKVD